MSRSRGQKKRSGYRGGGSAEDVGKKACLFFLWPARQVESRGRQEFDSNTASPAVAVDGGLVGLDDIAGRGMMGWDRRFHQPKLALACPIAELYWAPC